MNCRMVSKTILLIALVLFSCVSLEAAQPEIEVWKQPGFPLDSVKKVLIVPVRSKMELGKEVIPESYLNKELTQVVVQAFSTLKNKTILAKSTRDAWKNILLTNPDITYDITNPSTMTLSAKQDYLKRAHKAGFSVVLYIQTYSTFSDEIIPARNFSYTTYDSAFFSGSHGLHGTIMVPQQKTMNIPEYAETYLFTASRIEVCDLNNDLNDDYIAACEYTLYKRYQGGDVIPPLKKAITTCVQKLFSTSSKK